MQGALQRLPPLFAAGADPKAQQGQVSISVTCCLSDDGKHLLMNASSPAAFHSGLFGAAGLTKVKAAASAAMQWDEFFEQLEKAFTSKDIKFTYDSSNLVVSVPIAGGAAPFTLVKQQLSAIQGQALVLQQMCDAYTLRADKAAEDTTLADLMKKENDWNTKIHALQQSKAQLAESIHAAEDEEAALRRQCNELQREFESLQRQRAAEGSDVGDDGDIAVEPDFTTCVGRIPLGDRLHKDLDLELMKIIKSKFTPKKEGEVDAEGDDKPAPYNTLITPFTISEFVPYLKTFEASEKFLVMKCFDKIDAWDFDVFTIQDFTNKGSLFITAYALFLRYDFLRKFNLDEQVVVNFLSQIEAGYHPNPYHNSMHAADVLHILHYILTPGGLTKQAQLTEEDVFAALIAGMIHDYDHPGTNNNFHVKVQSYLATLYNDRSMLENHHCAEVWELMKNSNFNLLTALADEQRRDVRETVIDMVLSTDMGLHAKILGQWKRRIGQDMELQKKEDQRLALAMAIKMADISNCGRPEALYLKWAHKIAEEFFLQGDRERNLGNTVSPFMDRSVPSMAKGQIAFMNYIVIPLFESISEYLPAMHFSVEHCEQNKSYWTANTDDIGS